MQFYKSGSGISGKTFGMNGTRANPDEADLIRALIKSKTIAKFRSPIGPSHFFWRFWNFLWTGSRFLSPEDK